MTCRFRLSLWLLAGALAAPLAFADSQPSADAAAWLGAAPRRFEPQAPDWKAGAEPKAALSRQQVADLYNTVYTPGSAVAVSWTGSVASCNAGTTASAHQQAVIDRVNYFRTLAGLPSVSLVGGTPNTQNQAAALMFSANGSLSHSPPTSWTCYSSAGAAGAGSSNIALGAYGVGAVDLYVDDPGTGNEAAGHRRWVLYPPKQQMATGDVPGSGGQWAANALYVFGANGTRPATPQGTPWPPAGYVPYQNLPSGSNRWSFSYPNASFSAASVQMTGPSGSIPVTLETIANGYGDNTLVFKPTGVSYAKPSADTNYTITVSGMTGSGVPSSVQYTVTVIDPASTPVTVTPQTGWYWNPNESGRGFFVETRNGNAFISGFYYADTGRATWFVATGPVGSSTFQGTMLTYANGQTLTGSYRAPNQTTSPGNITLQFLTSTTATLTWPGGTVSLQRFPFGPGGTVGTPNSGAPENGWWWNQNESGRGFAMETQGGNLFIVGYMYDLSGNPIWYLSTGAMTSTSRYTGTWVEYANGQTLAGSYRAPNVVNSNVGALTIDFGSTTSATLTLPDGRQIPFIRFVF